MPKKYLLISVGLTAVTYLSSLIFSLSPSFSQSNFSASQPNKVTFFCRQIADRASGEKIPATVVWIPERRGHAYFIGWKSEYFNQGGWTPEKRCEHVTQKFQEFYEQGRLTYLTAGKSNGYPIICGLANQGEICNDKHQLFTLKTGSNPSELIQRLMDIQEGKSGDPLLQKSGNQLYIPVQDFLKKTPLLSSK